MGQALLSKLAAEPNTPFPYGTIEAEIPESSGPAKVWSASNLAQYKGTVRWLNNAKGYGFLGREGGADVFVHYSSLQMDGYKSLKEGDEVEFDIIQGTKGPQAVQVVRLGSIDV
jgi:CspA family cold shock protein